MWTNCISENLLCGIELAKRLNGEIISADSMQIYKEMNIGTAKVTPEEMQGVPHYLMDICEPTDLYSVSEYRDAAEKLIIQAANFRNIDHENFVYDFHLDSLSRARGRAVMEATEFLPYDKDGVERVGKPDIGCYQYKK